MTVGSNKNPLGREIGSDGKRDFNFGLCDCFSTCGLCCWAVWCPCIVYGKNRQRLQNLQSRGMPLQGGGSTCSGDCCIYCFVSIPGFAWLLQMFTRTDIRKRYEIRGSIVGDCCVSCCCVSCGLTQERREIEAEEKSHSAY
ncbi:PLAC8 family-domain-containing protein [Lactifluus subvellereus]|nr:PLAC8 family-domain-containing protein [Lactifluus subvellereus]